LDATWAFFSEKEGSEGQIRTAGDDAVSDSPLFVDALLFKERDGIIVVADDDAALASADDVAAVRQDLPFRNPAPPLSMSPSPARASSPPLVSDDAAALVAVATPPSPAERIVLSALTLAACDAAPAQSLRSRLRPSNLFARLSFRREGSRPDLRAPSPGGGGSLGAADWAQVLKKGRSGICLMEVKGSVLTIKKIESVKTTSSRWSLRGSRTAPDEMMDDDGGGVLISADVELLWLRQLAADPFSALA
jgi:hypothetical protein